MSTRTTSIRRARDRDVAGLSRVFDAAWREAYRGIIPGVALEKMIAQRDGAWWRRALRRGRPLAVVDIAETVVGYASYGRSRGDRLGVEGEVDELYLMPEYQGLGLGRRLFRAVRNDLSDHSLPRVGAWSLEENGRACAFYEGLGGKSGPRVVESFATVPLRKIGYRFG